jgi:hypothetical protein
MNHTASRKKTYSDEAEKIAKTIATGQFTHDYPINVARAESIGISVSTNMPKSIYKLMDLYAQEGSGRPSVNFVPVAGNQWAKNQ